jgi:hypothetical protein
MNYIAIYNSIIEFRRANPLLEGYFETHHIIPRCLGGSNCSTNLVKLSAREHYICHLLLTKIHPEGSVQHKKMVRAFLAMRMISSNQHRYVSSRNFDKFRNTFRNIQSENTRGAKNPNFGKSWYHNPKLKKNQLFNRGLQPKDWLVGRRNFEKLEKQKQLNILKEYEKTRNLEKYIEWYSIYNREGFVNFCLITGYSKSKPNLVQMFSKYVPQFIPQNGRRRG